MERAIIKDVVILSKKCEPAQRSDLSIGQDLVDTLHANKRSVGLAANMIGVSKRIIVVKFGKTELLMFNPVLRAKHSRYTNEEGCLSLEGARTVTRYFTITVEYRDPDWKLRTITFHGLPAEIVQHEMDHLEGILI